MKQALKIPTINTRHNRTCTTLTLSFRRLGFLILQFLQLPGVFG
jgi:hypothetical protein